MWLDEAFWKLLFSLLLLVIMILWRPTNNNQRYAFTPLLDSGDETEEDDIMVNENLGNFSTTFLNVIEKILYHLFFCVISGMKMRVNRANNVNTPSPRASRDDQGSIVNILFE